MEAKYMDLSVRPGDDFFRYAAGNWLKFHPQPADEPSWGAFDVVDERVRKRLAGLIEAADSSDDPMARKISAFRRSMRDYGRRDREGEAQLRPYVDEIRGADTKEQVTKYMIRERLFGEMFFDLSLGIDEKNSDRYEVHAGQSLSLYNREYYLSSDPKKKALLDKYEECSVETLVRFGIPREEAREWVGKYFEVESEIAEVAYSPEKLEKCDENYHPMTVGELSRYVGADMRRFLSWRDFDATEKVIVAQPEPVRKAFELMNAMSVEDFKKCALYAVICSNCGTLSDEYGDIWFEYTKVATGAEKRADRWKRETDAVESTFPDTLGRMYAEKYFKEEWKDRVSEMVEAMSDSFREIVSEQEWMSPNTRERALGKLASIGRKLAYPDEWEDWTGMPVRDGESYFETCRAISGYFHDRTIRKYYNKPVDRKEWPMDVQSVNACYVPTLNEICFPCAVMQEPFFDGSKTDAENYGAIGAIIGHEMTHALDTNGRLFDSSGNMHDWWEPEDGERFERLTENARKRFDSLEVLPGVKCDGSLTLNENIADYGGLKIAWRAFQKRGRKTGRDSSGLDDAQRFFVSYAQTWAGTSTEETLRKKTLEDEHSANFVRVDGTLPMFSPWYSAFGVEPGDPMFVPEKDRGRVW